MHSDKDLPFGDVDQLPLDDDPRRRAARNAASQIKAGQTQKPASPPPAKPRPAARSAAPKPSGSRLPWVLLIVVLVLALAGGYGLFTQLNGMQERLAVLQSQSADQLDSLQNTLSSSSSTVSAQQGKIQDGLAAVNKELTRLAANDLATRKRVSALEDANKQLQATVKQLDTLKKQLAAAQQSLTALDGQQKTQTTAVGQLQMRQDLLVSSNKELTSGLMDQKKRVDQMADTSAKLTQLQKDIADVQASIKAFDQWRAQVNSKLY